MSHFRSPWLRVPSLVLVTLVVLLTGALRARSDAPVAAWVVLDEQYAGLQLFADARQPYQVPGFLNASTAAEGVVVGGDEPFFQGRTGPALRVAAYRQLPAWQQRLSDLLMAVRSGNVPAARILFRQAHAAALAGGPEALEHGLAALSADLDGLAPADGGRRAEVAARVSALLLQPRDNPHFGGVEISTEGVGFGQACIGEKVTRTFTLTTSVPDFRVTINGSANAPFTVTGLPVTITTGQTATVTVTFTPTEAGVKQDKLELKTGFNDSFLLPVAGEGVNTHAIRPQVLDFGEVLVGNSKELSFEIKNCTAKELSVKIAKPKSKVFALEIPAPISIAPLKSETYTVQFSPEKPNTIYRDQLKLTVAQVGVKKSKEADVVFLRGQSVGPLSVSTKIVDFGVVPKNTPKQMQFTLTNTTQQPLPVKLDTINVDERFFHLSQSGSLTLQPGQSQTITVDFEATGKCSHRENLIVDFGTGFPPQRILVQFKAISQ